MIAASIVVTTLVVLTNGKAPAVPASATALVVAGLVGIATVAELFAGPSTSGVVIGFLTLRAKTAFGLAPQRLFSVVIATDEGPSVRDLEEHEDTVVIAAQTDRLLRDAPAQPGALCLVTADSADALADSSLVALWRELSGTAPKTAKTWIAVGIVVGTIVAAPSGMLAVELVAAVSSVCEQARTGAGGNELGRPPVAPYDS